MVPTLPRKSVWSLEQRKNIEKCVKTAKNGQSAGELLWSRLEQHLMGREEMILALNVRKVLIEHPGLNCVHCGDNANLGT
ncbi:hypothetical protein L596_014308 [Steinernema carpocapsae]|uniref:Uncharacterized protein n=1 Tax=Steinernema carpocapsae TaxID=34508 RepID=A0A4U5NBL0_STECR|nr:hypothetical protein L596_014308 [Steinernema carpocapsae]